MADPKSLYDLIPLDPVRVRIAGRIQEAQFIGFLRDGLECQVGTWVEYTRPDGSKGRRPVNPIVPVSSIVIG